MRRGCSARWVCGALVLATALMQHAAAVVRWGNISKLFNTRRLSAKSNGNIFPEKCGHAITSQCPYDPLKLPNLEICLKCSRHVARRRLDCLPRQPEIYCGDLHAFAKNKSRAKTESRWFPSKFQGLPTTQSTSSYSKVRIFNMVPSATSREDLETCFKRNWGRSIFDESKGAIQELHGYTPEDLGDYYLDAQVEAYPARTTSLELADVVIINAYPILSWKAGWCHGTSHIDRQKEVFQWIDKHKRLLTERPTIFPCTSWLCRIAVGGRHSIMLAEIKAAVLINELNSEWMNYAASDTWRFLGGRDSHGAVRKHHGIETNETRKHHGIAIPYTGHHSIPRPPKPGLVKTCKFLFIGSFRVGVNGTVECPVRNALNAIKDDPDVFLEETSLEWDFVSKIKKRIVRGYETHILRAEFCFVPRGDTPTSRRLFDAMLAGCLPVIIADSIDVSLPFSSNIPYNDFAFRIPEQDWVQNPKAVLQQLKQVSAGEVEQRRASMANYAPFVDWLNGTNVLAMILDEIVNGRQHLLNGTKY